MPIFYERTSRLFFPALLCACILWLPLMAGAQDTSALRQMAGAAMRRWPDGKLPEGGNEADRNAELGILLAGMDAAWYGTANGAYFRYGKAALDPMIIPMIASLIDSDTSMSPSQADTTSLNRLLLGRQLLLLYGVTQETRYYEAAKRLRQQLRQNAAQTTPKEQSFAGLYAAEPFFAAYAREFQQPQDFAGITQRFVRANERARNRFSAQEAGWMTMALVDTLPSYPENDPGRPQLLTMLQRTAAELARQQDAASGLWSQNLAENDFDSPAACMLTYALARAVRLGYLPQSYEQNAERAWRGIEAHFEERNNAGGITLTDGSAATDNKQKHRYESTAGRTVTADGPAAVGLYLLAASEMEAGPKATAGLGTKVMLDAWYNSQTRQNAAGQTELYHYKWDDYANSGFSLFGHIFRSYGLATETLDSVPTVEKLRDAQFYIIVSPDNPAKNPRPHYMTADDAGQIAQWVRDGGVLLMMENDRDNADIPHMDLLADKFGLHFNNVLVHHVIGDDHAMGRIDLPSAAAPFTHPHVLYMKDTCSLTLSQDARPLLRYKGDLLVAMARYGKGMVFAVTDPWVYNEYTDGRNLPPEYDNFAAGEELVQWLLQQRAQLPH